MNAVLDIGRRGIDEQMRRLVGTKIGMIHEVFELLSEREDAQVCGFLAVSNLSDRFSSASSGPGVLSSTGFGLSTTEALRRAFGEMAERYSLASAPDQGLIAGSARSLERKGYDIPDIETLRFFSEEQYASRGFRYSPFESDDLIHWVRGVNFRTGKQCVYPAQLVFLNATGDPVKIGYPTSSGAAASYTLEDAILSALREALERDAMMLTWYGRIIPSIIELPTEENQMCDMYVRHFCFAGFENVLLDIRLDHSLPVCACFQIEHSTGGRSAVLGCAADLSVENAIQKALLESAQARIAVRNNTLLRGTPSSIGSIRKLGDNATFYSQPSSFTYVKPMIELPIQMGKRSTRIDVMRSGNSSSNLKQLLRHLSRREFDTYVFDITAPDVVQAGYRVVKVVVPQLVPMCAPRNPCLGSIKFCLKNRQLNLSGRERWGTFPNPLPHPLG